MARDATIVCTTRAIKRRKKLENSTKGLPGWGKPFVLYSEYYSETDNISLFPVQKYRKNYFVFNGFLIHLSAFADLQ
jgi:hypothetical protein